MSSAKKPLLKTQLAGLLKEAAREDSRSEEEKVRVRHASHKTISLSVYPEDVERANAAMQKAMSLGRPISFSQAVRLLIRQADPKAITHEALDMLARDDQRVVKSGR